jgi:hypothetical protein
MRKVLPLLALVVALDAAPALSQQAADVACGVVPFRPRVPVATLAADLGDRYPSSLLPSFVGAVSSIRSGVLSLTLDPRKRPTYGDVVSIFRPPRPGPPLRDVDEVIGSARVEMVLERVALAKVTSGASRVQPGDHARLRAQDRIPLPVVALVDPANDPAAGAAVRELLDALTATRRFEVSTADALATTLQQGGLREDDILEGRGFADAATRFNVDHVLVVASRSVHGTPYVDARIFWLAEPLRRGLFSLRPACQAMTGDIGSQAGFDAHRRGCLDGDASHCTGLGALYERPPFDGRTARALRLAAAFYRLGCDGGDGAGCSALGWMYRRGLGVSKGPERAVRLSRQGCAHGDGRGCAQLAELYETGAGVTPDVRQASDLYRRACAMGARGVCGP